MLSYLHTTIQTLLHSRAGIPRGEVDVRFERPRRQWVDSLVRPTINLFLFDMAEQQEYRNVSAPPIRNGAHATTRLPPRRMELRYQISVFSSETEDEHTLLWRTQAALLRHTNFAQLPPETLRLAVEGILRRERYIGAGQSPALPQQGKELTHADVQGFCRRNRAGGGAQGRQDGAERA
jgi:hypothetical protein